MGVMVAANALHDVGILGRPVATYAHAMVTPDDEAMQARSRDAKRAALATVKERIRRRMGETGISAAKLAVRANVSPRMVQRFLADEARDVQLGNVAAIAEVLLIDVRELFGPLRETEVELPCEPPGETS